MIKHHNFTFDGGSPDLPLATGDRYYAQDLARDFNSLRDHVGNVLKDISTNFPVVIEGGGVEQGAGDSLTIASGVGYAKFQVTIPDDSTVLPMTTTTADIEAIKIEWTNQINMTLPSATLDGVTTNYVKVRYVEGDTNTRQRAKKAGTYPCEKTPGFFIDVNSTAPTDYEVCLAEFTGSTGGTFIFNNTNRDGQLGVEYDYIVKDQADFNHMWKRVSSTEYHIRDDIKSVFFKPSITFNVANLITVMGDGGSTVLTLKTNNCVRINANFSTLNASLLTNFQFSVNTNFCKVEGLTVQGDSATAQIAHNVFYIEAFDVTCFNCDVRSFLSPATAFSVNGTYSDSVKFVCCQAFSGFGVGFFECRNLTSCISNQISGNGFSNCKRLTSCRSVNCTASDGFVACDDLSSCEANTCTGAGFATCKRLSSCFSTGSTYGYYQCTFVSSSCHATGNTNNFSTIYGSTSASAVIGCLEDGRLLFCKEISGTATSSTLSIAHGISNAYTSSRIVECHPRTHVTGSSRYRFVDTGSLVNGAIGSDIDNINVNVYLNYGAPVTVFVQVVYQ